MRFALGQSRRCGTERRMLDEVSLAGGAAQMDSRALQGRKTPPVKL